MNATGIRKRSAFLLLAVLIAVLTTLSGCSQTGNAGAAGDLVPTASTASRPVTLHLDVGDLSLESPDMTIIGTVTPGATVTVNHHHASVHGRHWRTTLHLHLGANKVNVVATLAGRHSAHRTIVVTRKKSTAEVEAETQEREQRAQEQERSAAATPTPTPTPEETCTNGTYVNSAGNTVCRPEESSTVPSGATAECRDGTYSFSESRSGTCSHHGGVARWLE